MHSLIHLALLGLFSPAAAHDPSVNGFIHSGLPFYAGTPVVVTCHTHDTDYRCFAHETEAVDMAIGGNPRGFPVVAEDDGVVVSVTRHSSGWGLVIAVLYDRKGEDGSDVWGFYAHLERSFVYPGTRIRAGQPIAGMGGSGGWTPHLHRQDEKDAFITSNVNIPMAFADVDAHDTLTTSTTWTSGNDALFQESLGRWRWLWDGEDLARRPASYPWIEAFNGTEVYDWSPGRWGVSHTAYGRYMTGGAAGNGTFIVDGLDGGSGWFVRSGFGAEMDARGGATNWPLGYPLGEEYSTAFFASGAQQSARQDFQLGRLEWNKPAEDQPGAVTLVPYTDQQHSPGMFDHQAGATVSSLEQSGFGAPLWMNGWFGPISYRFADTYFASGGATLLGDATNGVHEYLGFLVQDFDGDQFGRTQLVYDPSATVPDEQRYEQHRAHWIHGAFLGYWEANSGQLGAPVTAEFADGSGYCRQDFANGDCLLWVADDGAGLPIQRQPRCTDQVSGGRIEVGRIGVECALDDVVAYDPDGDGVDDLRGCADRGDCCPASEPNAIVDGDGCSVLQRLPHPVCSSEWANHGEFVSEADRVLRQFVDGGWLTETERQCLHQVVVHADVGSPEQANGPKISCQELSVGVVRGGVCDEGAASWPPGPGMPDEDEQGGCGGGGSASALGLMLLALLGRRRDR